MYRERNPTVATLLTLCCPGLGYLYVGRFAAGLVANAAFLGLLVAFVGLWTYFEFFPLLPGAVLVVAWLVFTGFVASEVRSIAADRDEPYELKSYNHWTIYSAVVLILYVVPIAGIVLFTGTFFWSVTPIETAGMYPNLTPGDSVLVRKGTYDDRKEPKPGDLVAVQFPGVDGYRILRVLATGPTTVDRAANEIEVGQRKLPRIPLEATGTSTTASVSEDVPVPASPPADGSSDGADQADETDGDDDSDDAPNSKEEAAFDPGAYELMVERNAAAKYVVSLRPSATAKPTFETYELEKDELFLLADNRSAPDRQTGDGDVRDSRVFGPVRRDAISGEPLYVAWSTHPSTGAIRWNRIGLRLQ